MAMAWLAHAKGLRKGSGKGATPSGASGRGNGNAAAKDEEAEDQGLASKLAKGKRFQSETADKESSEEKPNACAELKRKKKKGNAAEETELLAIKDRSGECDEPKTTKKNKNGEEAAEPKRNAGEEADVKSQKKSKDKNGEEAEVKSKEKKQDKNGETDAAKKRKKENNHGEESTTKKKKKRAEEQPPADPVFEAEYEDLVLAVPKKKGTVSLRVYLGYLQGPLMSAMMREKRKHMCRRRSLGKMKKRRKCRALLDIP